MTRTILALCLLGSLAACGGGETRYAVPRLEVTERIPSRYASVEVREVTLPTYAAEEDIAFAREGGAVETGEGLLWADDPSRAVTLELTRALATVSGAIVAPEPWPFRDPPAAVVDVRIEDMSVEAGGVFRLTGQAFVAPDAGGGRAEYFAVRVPLGPDPNFADLAVARAKAVGDLAVVIARNLR